MVIFKVSGNKCRKFFQYPKMKEEKFHLNCSVAEHQMIFSLSLDTTGLHYMKNAGHTSKLNWHKLQVYLSLQKFTCVIFFLSAILFSAVTLSAQTFSYVDSLESALKGSIGHDKVTILLDLANYYAEIDPDKAIKFAGEITGMPQTELAEKSEGYKILADAYFYKNDYWGAIGFYDSSARINSSVYGSMSMEYAERLGDIGFCYDLMVHYDKAIEHFRKALAISYFNDREDEIANNLNNIGKIYYQWGNYDSSIYYFENAVALDKKLGEQVYIGIDLNNIAKVYESWGKFRQALMYYKESLQIAEKEGNENSVAIRNSNIGNIYKALGNFDSAIYHYKVALEIDEKNANEQKIGIRLANLGEIFFLTGDFSPALSYYREALTIFRKAGNPESEALVLKNLGDLYTEAGNTLKAEKCYMQSLKIADSLNLRPIQLSVFKQISSLYEKTGNYKESLVYHRKYDTLEDSLFTAEKHRQLAEYQTLYQTEKKQKEIELLSKEKAIRDSDLKRAKNYRIFLMTVSAMLVMLAVLLFSRYRLKRKTNILLSKKNDELTLLNATKDKFFSIIAHDLKNPLSGFITISRSLNENADNLSTDEIQYFTKELHHTSRQLYELLQNLLQWARSQTGSLKYNPEAKELHTLVEENFSLLQSNAHKKHIKLVNETQPDTMVYADPNMVNTVLRNLISNAINFSNPQGKITIQSRRENENILVAVSDTGIGIEPDDIPKLFRIDIDTSKIGLAGGKGTGLGLILCKELISKNAGEISVSSEAGKGSTFLFTLPSAN